MNELILIVIVVVIILLGLFTRKITRKTDITQEKSLKETDKTDYRFDCVCDEITNFPKSITNKYHGYLVSENGERIFIDRIKIGNNIETIEIIDCWLELIEIKNKDSEFSLRIDHCHKTYTFNGIPDDQIKELVHILGRYFQKKPFGNLKS